MIKKITFLFNLVFYFYNSYSQPDSIMKMFRSVQLQNGRSFKLQSLINNLDDIIIKTSKDHYNLKKHVYSGSDSIDIQTNKNSQIIVVTFLYDTTYLYEKKVFTNFIGLPKEYEYSSEIFKVKISQWQDEKSILELVEMIENGKSTIYGALFDKEAYSREIKIVNESPTNISWELLRKTLRFKSL